MTAPVQKESYWQEEPARLSGQVAALLGLAAASGLQLSDQTTAAITSLTAGVATLLGLYFLRTKVTSPATARRLKAAAAVAPGSAGDAMFAQIEQTPLEVADDTQPPVMGKPHGLDPLDGMPSLNPPLVFAGGFHESFDPPADAAGPHPEYKLGRLVNHDERSKQYGIVPVSAEKIVSRRWGRRAPVFDQGQVGSCTANAACGWLVTDDASRQGVAVLADGTPVDEKMCLSVYSAAETIDGDGPYPPNDNGSSGLSVAKVLKQRGLCSGYLHAFTLSAVYTALQSGPGMAGTTWYNSMFNTAADGHIHVDKTSGVAGGHEYLIDELEVAPDGTVQKIWMQNSWGTGWGVSGRGWFTPAEFGALLAASGDFTQPAPAVVPAPTPAPAPTPPPAPAPGPDAGFPAAVAVYAGLADWLAARAEKKGMTPNAYAAWVLAGEAHKR